MCRANSTQIPLFTNVFVIMMENTTLATLQTGITGNKAPNLKTWQGQYATAPTTMASRTRSLPNYIALTSGDTKASAATAAPSPAKARASPCSTSV